MKKFIFLLLLCGCQEPAETTHQKCNRALSQVNVLAEKLSKQVGTDGENMKK